MCSVVHTPNISFINCLDLRMRLDIVILVYKLRKYGSNYKEDALRSSTSNCLGMHAYMQYMYHPLICNQQICATSCMNY